MDISIIRFDGCENLVLFLTLTGSPFSLHLKTWGKEMYMIRNCPFWFKKNELKDMFEWSCSIQALQMTHYICVVSGKLNVWNVHAICAWHLLYSQLILLSVLAEKTTTSENMSQKRGQEAVHINKNRSVFYSLSFKRGYAKKQPEDSIEAWRKIICLIVLPLDTLLYRATHKCLAVHIDLLCGRQQKVMLDPSEENNNEINESGGQEEAVAWQDGVRHASPLSGWLR